MVLSSANANLEVLLVHYYPVPLLYYLPYTST